MAGYYNNPTAGITPANWWDGALTALPAQGSAAPPIDLSALGQIPAVQATPTTAWDDFSSMLGGVFNQNAMFGGTNLANNMKTTGWVSPALGVASGLASTYLGYKQYQVAKDTLEQNKRAFNLNFEAQKKTTNAALSDRQAARVASNPTAYQSVGDYMKQYGI